MTRMIFCFVSEYKCVKHRFLLMLMHVLHQLAFDENFTLHNNHEISILTLYWMLSILTFAQTSTVFIVSKQ